LNGDAIYHLWMTILTLLTTATDSCQKTSAGSAALGLIILLGLIGGIIGFAVANGRARSRLAVATNELNYLRPEYARLQQWASRVTGAGPGAGAATAPGTGLGSTPGDYPIERPVAAQWHPDPSGRHQFRYWEGSGWTAHVSDDGVVSHDPPVS
jgi:hypothetical protein